MTLRPVLLALALAAPAAAPAQTFAEAVRANVALGVELCTRHMSNVQATIAALAAAQFTYRMEAAQGGFETRHVFEAPADTARIILIEGQMVPECIVGSTHMGLTEAGPFVGAVLQQRFPGRVRPEPTGDLCRAYSDGGELPFWIYVAHSRSGSGTCAEEGSSLIFISNDA